MIRCPFCRFETEYPAETGKVYECLGECYSTYMRIDKDHDSPAARMRLVEIFFVDPAESANASVDDLELCEFKEAAATEAGERVLFARERRVTEEEIDAITGDEALEPGWTPGMFLRLRASLDRFERYMNENAPASKLAKQARVIHRLSERFAAILEKNA